MWIIISSSEWIFIYLKRYFTKEKQNVKIKFVPKLLKLEPFIGLNIDLTWHYISEPSQNINLHLYLYRLSQPWDVEAAVCTGTLCPPATMWRTKLTGEQKSRLLLTSTRGASRITELWGTPGVTPPLVLSADLSWGQHCRIVWRDYCQASASTATPPWTA